MAEHTNFKANSGILKSLELQDVIYQDNASVIYDAADGSFAWLIPGSGTSIVRFRGPIKSIGVIGANVGTKLFTAAELYNNAAANVLYSQGDPQNTAGLGGYLYRIIDDHIAGFDVELTLLDANGGEVLIVTAWRGE